MKGQLVTVPHLPDDRDGGETEGGRKREGERGGREREGRERGKEDIKVRMMAHLSWSMCWSASYMQKGLSMVVHSFINSMEPPVSAEMSQMASSL